MVARRASIAALPVALALASCGGDDGGEIEGPASLVPPEAPIYLEATVDPDSAELAELRDLIEGLAGLPVLGTAFDAEDLIDRAFEEFSAETGEELRFEDVEPWLGERAGLAVGSLDQDVEDGMLALEVTDEDAARATLDRFFGDTEQSEYEGVEYRTDPGQEVAIAVFDGFAVLAQLDYFEAVVDAAQGDSLGDSERFTDAFESLDGEALARAYLDFAEVSDEQISDSVEDVGQVAVARDVLPELFSEPLVAAASVEGDAMVVDVAIRAGEEAAPEESDFLTAAPGDSVLAVGIDDPAAIVNEAIERVEAAGEAMGEPLLGPGSLAEAFEARFGLSLDDAIAEFGDGVAWFRGDNEGGTIGVELSLIEGAGDPTTGAPLQLLTQLGDVLEAEPGVKLGPPLDENGTGFSALRSTPDSGGVALYNAEIQEDRVSLLQTSPPSAAGEPPDDDLGASEAFADGVAALGEEYQPLAYGNPRAILEMAFPLASVTDVVAGDASLEDASVGFLANQLGYAVAGTRSDGDALVTRIMVGVE